MDLNPQEMQTLKALLGGLGNLSQKNDPVPATAEGTSMVHGFWGPGALAGLWTTPGVTPDMFSTLIRSITPASLFWGGASNVNNIWLAEYETMTGITDGSGTSPTSACDEPCMAGSPKGCIQKAYFGDITRRTPTRDGGIIGNRLTLADTDRRIINHQLETNPFIPEMAMPSTNENWQLFWDLYTVGVDLERDLARMLFQGVLTTAAGASQYCAIREFDGLDVLINNGKVDALSGVACPALDSTIYNANYAIVGAGVLDYVELIADIYNRLTTLASRTRMDPVQWVILMEPDLFKRLTQVWPCSYLTNRCNTFDSTQDRRNSDAREGREMELQMWRGKFLWIEGDMVPVLPCEGMAVTTIGAGFSSDIYFVPVVARGQKVTWLEAFDQANADARGYWNATGNNDEIAFSNGGAYSVVRNHQHWCLQYEFRMLPRLVMRTPQLAARIQNVEYALSAFGINNNDFMPGDVYHRDGGQVYRTAPTQYRTAQTYYPQD